MEQRIRSSLFSALAITPLLLPLFFLTEKNSWTTGLSVVLPDIVLGLPWSIGVLAIGTSLRSIFPEPYDHIFGFVLLAICIIINSLLLSKKITYWGIFIISLGIAIFQSFLAYQKAFD